MFVIETLIDSFWILTYYCKMWIIGV